MIQFTGYFRNEEDKKLWQAIPNKIAWLHNALNSNDSEILRTPELHKKFDEATKVPKIIKTPEDVPQFNKQDRQPIPKTFSARKKK